MAAPTMAQRSSCTPRLVLLAVVSAYYSAVAASENYVEISPSDGCADTTGTTVRHYTHTPAATADCNIPCDENSDRVRFKFTFHDYHQDNREGELGATVQWSPNIPEREYYLKSELDGFCETQTPTSRAVNLTVFQYEPTEPASLQISLLDGVSECVISTVELEVPVTCYDATRDCSRCLHYPRSNTALTVSADRVWMEGQLYWRVRWRWIQGKGRSYDGEIYHVRVSEEREGGTVRWLEVINKMELLLGNFSSSSPHTLSVWRYDCGCDVGSPMGRMTLDPLSYSSGVSETVSLPCPTTSPSVSSTSSSSSPPQIPTMSTFNATSHHPHPLTTFTAVTTPIHTNTTTSPKNGRKLLTIISISIPSVTLIVVATLIALALLARRKYMQKSNSKIDIHPFNPISEPVSSKSQSSSILVLYSTKTPAEETKRINELLVGGLGQYNVSVVTPDTVTPRELTQEWIEEGLRERQAVLLVCNRQLWEEWQGKNCEGDMKVAGIVKVMVGSLADADRKKIKCVYLREEEKVYSSPTLLIRHPICLADTGALDKIAQFVLNFPTYEV